MSIIILTSHTRYYHYIQCYCLYRNVHLFPSLLGICFECFEEDDELRPLPCGHSFHRGCIDDWLLGLKSDIKAYTRNCPCCRQDISLPSLSRSASIASSIDTSTLTTVNSQEVLFSHSDFQIISN